MGETNGSGFTKMEDRMDKIGPQKRYKSPHGDEYTDETGGKPHWDVLFK